MTEKKTKKTASKKSASKKTTKKSTKSKKTKSKKNKDAGPGDMGIVVIEDDLQVDKDAELEARKAYLEEARSQEAFD